MSEEGTHNGGCVLLGVSDALETSTITDSAFQARFGFLTSDGGRTALGSGLGMSQEDKVGSQTGPYLNQSIINDLRASTRVLWGLLLQVFIMYMVPRNHTLQI